MQQRRAERVAQPDPHSAADENDSRAYLEAGALLDDGQRQRAQEIASEYREQLFNGRQGARK